MKKLIVFVLLLMSCCSNFAYSQEFECPQWVKDAGKCDAFMVVIEAADKYQMTLSSGWVISNAEYKNNHIFITIERGSLQGVMNIGEFKNVKGLSVENNKLMIEYYDQAEINSRTKTWWFLGGFGGSSLLWLLVLLLI